MPSYSPTVNASFFKKELIKKLGIITACFIRREREGLENISSGDEKVKQPHQVDVDE